MRSKQLLLPAVAMLLVIFVGGCKKDMGANPPSSSLAYNSMEGRQMPHLASVDLGVAGNFVILSQSGITNVPASTITGDIGTGPITGAAITGLTSSEVAGTIYTVDATGPASKVTDATRLTTAIGDMHTAYTDAAGRPSSGAAFMNVAAGTLSGLVLTPGVYTWTSAVNITKDITLFGHKNDVFIFQVAGTLDIASEKKIILTGGAQAKNIFWQVAGAVTLGAYAHIEGIILGKTNIVLQKRSSIIGRTLAQTAVTLDQNSVTQPRINGNK